MVERDSYWTDDVAIGEIAVSHRGPRTLRLKVHHAEEPGVGSFEEFFKLKDRRGIRDYYHARPYVLEPDIRLTIGLYPQPADQAPSARCSAATWWGCAIGSLETARHGSIEMTGC